VDCLTIGISRSPIFKTELKEKNPDSKVELQEGSHNCICLAQETTPVCHIHTGWKHYHESTECISPPMMKKDLALELISFKLNDS
jgi:hypothetical protein